MVDTLTTAVNSLIPQGLPIISGGLIGFVLGWLCRKIIKIAIIGVGLILALLAYLEYHKTITVNWNVANHQASTLLHIITAKMLQVVNNISTDLHSHVTAFPVLGIIGFVPGFAFGIMRG
jgi:uncharacterized membrane protein (Fun14 family)